MSENKKKEKRVKLPNKIITIPCADKDTWTEKWYPNRNLLNFPHSWRGFFCGPPSCGKTNLIKNIILRAQPPFEEVIVCHYSAEDTIEWDDSWHCPKAPHVFVGLGFRKFFLLVCDRKIALMTSCLT